MATVSLRLPRSISSVFCIFYLVFSCIFCSSLPAPASEVRISRPAAVEDSVDSVDSCCQGAADGPRQEGAIVLPGSALVHFFRWRKRYINPVFCPVLLCHGSCGNFDDACTLESERVLLDRVSGCAGACR
jgi:hypothetical protein